MVRAFHFKISRILEFTKTFCIVDFLHLLLFEETGDRADWNRVIWRPPVLVLSQKQKAKNIIPDLLTYKILYSEREELINHTLKWFFANKYGWIHGTMSWSTLDSYITNCNELSQCAKCSAVCITNDMHQPFDFPCNCCQLLLVFSYSFSVVQTWNICFFKWQFRCLL